MKVLSTSNYINDIYAIVIKRNSSLSNKKTHKIYIRQLQENDPYIENFIVFEENKLLPYSKIFYCTENDYYLPIEEFLQKHEQEPIEIVKIYKYEEDFLKDFKIDSVLNYEI